MCIRRRRETFTLMGSFMVMQGIRWDPSLKYWVCDSVGILRYLVKINVEISVERTWRECRVEKLSKDNENCV